MGRHDDADVSSLTLPDPPDPTTSYIGKGGQSVASEKEAFAKIVQDKGRKLCYIKYGRGDLFDPFGPDRDKQNRPYFDFKKVKSGVFDHYLSYLKRRERIYFTRARRLMMEI